MRTYTTCALESTCAYEYGFARKATYYVRIRLVRSRRLVRTNTALHVKQLILQGLSSLVEVAMTVDGC